jgi:hypothetical protein
MGKIFLVLLGIGRGGSATSQCRAVPVRPPSLGGYVAANSGAAGARAGIRRVSHPIPPLFFCAQVESRGLRSGRAGSAGSQLPRAKQTKTRQNQAFSRQVSKGVAGWQCQFPMESAPNSRLPLGFWKEVDCHRYSSFLQPPFSVDRERQVPLGSGNVHPQIGVWPCGLLGYNNSRLVDTGRLPGRARGRIEAGVCPLLRAKNLKTGLAKRAYHV